MYVPDVFFCAWLIALIDRLKGVSACNEALMRGKFREDDRSCHFWMDAGCEAFRDFVFEPGLAKARNF